MQLQLELEDVLSERTPHKPYCGLEKGPLRIRKREEALKYPYVQANPPHLRFWLLYDIDRPGGGLEWERAGLPMPAWAAINRENAHAHLAWGLTAPVLIGENAREAPLKYLCAIESAYRQKLCADPGYAGLITKNPLHPLWKVLHGPQRFYELDELAEYVDLDKHRVKRGRVEEIGLGRNCTLFDWLRLWAYKAVREHRETRNYALWQAQVYDMAMTRNGDFLYPLSGNEVWHIAKSVSKWTWQRDAQARARFIAKQSARGRKGGIAKGAANENKRATARLMAAKGMTQRAIAAELGVSVGSINAWLRSGG